MSSRRQVGDILEHLGRNPWMIILYACLGLGATYLQYKQAGWTRWFWLVLALILLVAFVATVVQSIRQRLAQRKERQRQLRLMAERTAAYQGYEQSIGMLGALITEFSDLEKTMSLAENVRDRSTPIRVIAIAPVEEQLGVLLNIGQEEGLEAGARLTVYRFDSHTLDGDSIERQLARVQVTYVQAHNNISQAVLLDQSDQEFWQHALEELRAAKQVHPPANFAAPYIPRELVGLTAQDLRILRGYLELILSSVTGHEPD
jgi:hypothetical protein